MVQNMIPYYQFHNIHINNYISTSSVFNHMHKLYLMVFNFFVMIVIREKAVS